MVHTFNWRPRHATPDAEPITIEFADDLAGDALVYLPMAVGHAEPGTLVDADGRTSRVYAIRMPVRALGDFGVLYVRERTRDALANLAAASTETPDEGGVSAGGPTSTDE